MVSFYGPRRFSIDPMIALHCVHCMDVVNNNDGVRQCFNLPLRFTTLITSSKITNAVYTHPFAFSSMSDRIGDLPADWQVLPKFPRLWHKSPYIAAPVDPLSLGLSSRSHCYPRWYNSRTAEGKHPRRFPVSSVLESGQTLQIPGSDIQCLPQLHM